MKFDELVKQIQLGIEPKKLLEFKYVNLIEQRRILNEVKSACLIADNNGFLKVDFILKDLFTLLYIVMNYSNIEIKELLFNDENINTRYALEIYDLFKKYNLDEFIYTESSCKHLLEILDKETKQELDINNSIALVIKNTLSDMIGKLPSENNIKALMSEIPTIMSSITSTPKKRNTTKKS